MFTLVNYAGRARDEDTGPVLVCERPGQLSASLS